MKRRFSTKKTAPGKEVSPKPSKTAKKSPPEDTIPLGEVLRDSEGKEWILDSVLRHGHRGPLYYASSKSSSKTEEYVIKIEPRDSSHLFKEFNCYQRAAKKKTIDTWMKQQHLSHLGVPYLAGAGQHLHDNVNYRFLVLQRLGPDIHTLMERSKALLSMEAVFWLGIRMLDCLEYLHDHDYVHGDVTAANILLGYREGDIDDSEVYLVDYGLAYRYRVDGKQKPYFEDSKVTPEGTVTFMSRDTHKGVAPSPRGDLEILGYCLLQWLCGRLPWEDKLTDKNYVKDAKIKFMENIPSYVKTCTNLESEEGSFATETMISYFTAVSILGYEEQPDYDRLRQLLRDCLSKLGIQEEWKPELLSQDDIKRSRRHTERIIPIIVESKEEKTLSKTKQKIDIIHESSSLKKSTTTTRTTQNRDVPKREERAKKGKAQQSSPLKEADKILVSSEESPEDSSPGRKLEIHKDGHSQHKSNKQSVSSKSLNPGSVSKNSRASSRKVTMNVGGRIFATLMSTLQKCPSKLLDIASKHSSQEEIFVDRDPTYFPCIVNFLRDEQTTLPDTTLDLKRLREESVYYGLTALTERIDGLLD